MELEMIDGKRRRRRHVQFTGNQLMLLACVLLTFYSVSMAIFQNAMLRIGDFNSLTELSDAIAKDAVLMRYATGAAITQLIGALALPIFAFLLVELFVNVSRFSRLILPLLIGAAVSEVPYDLAINNALWWGLPQNLLVTLLVCLVMLYGLRIFVDRKGAIFRIAQAFIIGAALLWCNFLQSSFSTGTILLVAVYYLFYSRKSLRVLIGCGVSTLYVTAPISGFALWNYTGDLCSKKWQLTFLVFYPLHLLLLGLLSRWIAA